jgi:7,8-dihydro-6-hydroxymethylpterin dimethyltransferase
MSKLLTIPVQLIATGDSKKSAQFMRDFLPPAPEESLQSLSVSLKSMSRAQTITTFGLTAEINLLKTTLSLCAQCLRHVIAAVYQSGDQVCIRKSCPEHGYQNAVLENDAAFYWTSNKDTWGVRFDARQAFDIPSFDLTRAGDARFVSGSNNAIFSAPAESSSCCAPGESCGPSSNSDTPRKATKDYTDQWQNKTCTVLIEITDACNLACKVCYADSNADSADGSRGDRLLPLAQFTAHLNSLIASKGSLDSIQITGGEASLHPQFWDIVDYACKHPGIAKVYLPTNGLLFSRAGNADKLKPYREKILVLLQFDGAEKQTNQRLRAADPLKIRLKLIQQLDRLGIAMQLTMTIARGVNEHEIAWVIDVGRRHRNVRLIALQPAFFSGRVEFDFDPSDRACLSDAVKGVAAGLGVRGKQNDFLPIPCSHPNCGWVTLFVRRFGLFTNIARQIDLNAVMNQVAYKTILDEKQMRSVLGTKAQGLVYRICANLARRFIRPKDVFGIVIKPFMDRYNYDQDRVSSCCHHILDTGGELVSFCEYNALHRHRDSWSSLPKLARS